MQHTYKILTIALVIAALVGCQQAAATPAASTEADAQAAPLPAERQRGDLEGVDRLALGTLSLEGSADAVTPEQAAILTPVIQGALFNVPPE